MKVFLVLSAVYLLVSEGTAVTQPSHSGLNERPIIGILSQEQAYSMKETYAQEDFTSYIAASYVKAVEAAGARVVPIMIGKSRDHYKEIMSKINGVLFPGGATYFNQSNGYADAGQHIYEIAKEMTDAGNYFPVFGTCLGFELLVILASGRGNPENRAQCRSFGNSPLVFNKGFRQSKMFRHIPAETADMMENRNATVNAHSFCILDKNMDNFNLTSDWQTLSYSYDEKGVKFISSIEHKSLEFIKNTTLHKEGDVSYPARYPIYGVQFHPEKTAYEWKKSNYYVHSLNAIQVNRYFMDFFVSECRKNHNSFIDETEENKNLIYNYKAYFTGLNGGYFTQCYFFEPRGAV